MQNKIGRKDTKLFTNYDFILAALFNFVELKVENLRDLTSQLFNINYLATILAQSSIFIQIAPKLQHILAQFYR